MRRPLVLAALGCAVGGLLVLLSSGQTWGSANARASIGARQHVTATGHAVAPALSALGIALLALAVALLAARRVVRRVVALAVVVAAAAVIPVAIDGHSSVGHQLADRAFGSTAESLGGARGPWWLVAITGGVLAIFVGAAVAVRGRRWSGLGTKYDAPAAVQADREAVDPWDVLDRGQDPTVNQ
jgi:uncharacterized membrane protein (TIGR02234 family)